MKPLGDLTDENLVLMAREGSQQAFHELVDRYTPAVFRLARGITRTQHEAEDIVQETFLRVFQHLDRFTLEKASFKTWLLTIARNQSINVFGSLKRKAARFFREPAAHEPDRTTADNQFGADYRDAEHLLSMKQDFSRLQKALATLPERQRTALLLKTQDDLSYDEIAQIMESSASAVESLIFRARQRVLALMKAGK
jgi:RNA polymerase sigma factor (sigma-70 family)